MTTAVHAFISPVRVRSAWTMPNIVVNGAPYIVATRAAIETPYAVALCANVRETSTRSEISVEGAMDLQDEEINQGSRHA
jgi:hypothetical protein